MPELPEVETVRRSLIDLIIGKKIKSVDVYYDRIIDSNVDEFKELLKGETFIDINRVGKFLIFILNHYIIVSHLRMEGKYFLKDNQEELPKEKHEHVIFNFDDGTTLRYNDTRKFGRMILFKTNNVEEVKKEEPLNKLGIEPISGKLTTTYLKEKFKNKKVPIKEVLLDQSIITGLGNIYADEVCFMSKLNPNKKASSLNEEELEKIIDSSKLVLEKAIKLGGTTIKSFVSSHAVTGLFQNELLVHTKERCPLCNEKIVKIRVGGRGTYYCPNCQKGE